MLAVVTRAPILIVGGEVMSSLKVAVIVSVSASLTIKSAPLLVRVTVGVVVSKVTFTMFTVVAALPAASVAL